MLGVALGEAVKHIVHGVLETFIILPYFHAVYHFNQRIHVAFFLRPLKDDIGHKGTVQKRFRFRPELVPLFTVPLGVGNQGIDEFQHIAFCLDVGHRVIVHRLGKIYAVEHLDLIALLFLQEVTALGEGAALGVYHHIGRMGLKELGREPEPRLARAGRTDDTGV